MSVPTAVAVHGGAGRVGRERLTGPGRRRFFDGLSAALSAAHEILRRGGSAVRAVTTAVRVLEDDEVFNAGRGAALCADGSVELSASVMNGRNLAVGAMVGLRRTRNPVLGAAALLDHKHGLLFGEQADNYARAAGLDQMETDYFVTPVRVRQWQALCGSKRVVLDHSGDEEAHGTVGAVARDRRGNLAAATSTGGLVNQLPGRVGDSPVVGAGTWADRRCAISATGSGDAFARIAFARRVADFVELAGMEPAAAARRALDEVARVHGRGGCVLIGVEGAPVAVFNSPHMIRGWVVAGAEARMAIAPGDEAARRPGDR
ncbi:MAG TPA: isoaspartyl peptidase/L-asparaginase [Candidatus Polarisedimenticolaceae bacterium]|nr:isoaspartyl peptidase/L-asparaginase [Candidatus Polarisedimenticolaceae bacterium]